MPEPSSDELLSPQREQTFTEPSYCDFLVESYRYFVRHFHSALDRDYFQQKFQQDLSLIVQQLEYVDFLIVAVLVVALTLVRHLATVNVFLPIANWRGISKSECQKIPESAWKLFFYLSTWTSTTYYLFFYEKEQYFQHPNKVWDNYSIHSPVTGFIYVIYTLELSFYIHSLYTTLFVDQRRKDTYTLMFHHVVCIMLITISYCNKSHKSGLLTLFLHDGSDVLLEATKLVRYFKVQHGKTYRGVETFVNIGFACFLLTWVSNRLYWFPIKQVYFASVYVESKQIQVPFIALLVTMLWAILLMNFYWFSFALRLLYKVVSGQIEELEDNREYKENDQVPQIQTDGTEETSNSAKTKTNDQEQRKLSVDSGVMIGDADEAETDIDTHSSNGSVNGDQNKPNSASNQLHLPVVYNLRQRPSGHQRTSNGKL